MTINRKTKNIALTVEQDEFVNDLVKTGQYQSASEVVRAGLRLLDQDLKRHQAELDEIRKNVRISLKAEANGRYTEGLPEEVITEVFDKIVKARGVRKNLPAILKAVKQHKLR